MNQWTGTRRPLAWASGVVAWVLVLGTCAQASAIANPDEWRPFAERDVIEIITRDPDEDLRETKIWIVVLDGTGYIRTNNSRWLANIRRGSPIALRANEWESRVTAVEIDDPALKAKIETAFKKKYGLMQRMMSFFRISEPTVLGLKLAGPTEADNQKPAQINAGESRAPQAGRESDQQDPPQTVLSSRDESPDGDKAARLPRPSL